MKKLMAIATAAVMALSLAACGKAADGDKKSAGVMTYAEYVAAAVDTPVTVETYVQAKQGWWEDKATIYTQDEDGAYFIYQMPISQEEYDKLTPGTKIKVVGTKSEWSGEVEIIDVTSYEIESGNYKPAAVDLTDKLSSDDLINYQNQFFTAKGLTVVAKQDANGNDAAFLYNWDGSGEAGSNSDLYFDVKLGDNTYTFTVESYLCGEGTDVYTAVTGLNVGDTIDVEGYLYWYNGVNPHITSVTVK